MFSNNFDGSNQRFTLYRHVANHRDAYNNMVSASHSENYTYQIPNEHTRVQRFLHSLTTMDQRIVSEKSFIIGNPNLLNDFAAATEYLLQVAPNTKTTPQRELQTIAALVQNKGGFKKYKVGKTGVELRYYKSAEFRKFNDAQKKELFQWREKNEKANPHHSKKHPHHQNPNTSQKKLKTLESTIAALKSEIATLKTRTAPNPNENMVPPGLTPPSRPTQSILRN